MRGKRTATTKTLSLSKAIISGYRQEEAVICQCGRHYGEELWQRQKKRVGFAVSWWVPWGCEVNVTITLLLFRAGWIKFRNTILKHTIQLWLILCLPPWRDPISVWTRRVPTSAAGPCMMRESSMPPLSSHAPLSLQRAEYECIAVLLFPVWGLFETVQPFEK